ncbi:MAG: tail fiber domain-containing protein [Bacteroidota bacterium]
MKKDHLFLLGCFILICNLSGQTIQRNFINYQGVARGADGALLAESRLDFGIGLRFGGENAELVYQEIHSTDTDANGVFSIRIGTGTVTTGDYNTLPWGSAAAFITTSINGTSIGTTEIMAVPYAISSGDGRQTAAQVPYDNTTSGLFANNAQEAIDALVSSGGSGTDDQNLQLTGDVLTIEAGTGSVDLSTYIEDADADPLNEVDVTTQTGILLGDGTEVTGLVGTTDGQVPKWDITASAWVPGDDEVGIGGGAEELNDLNDAITDNGTGSLFIGQNTGINNSTTGFNNTVVGAFSFEANTTGSQNTVLGNAALVLNLSGNANIAVGSGALTFNTTGNSNTAIGTGALQLNTIGENNTAIGRSALKSNTTGNANVAVGRNSLEFNVTGNANTAVGLQALRSNTTGVNNTATGTGSLAENTTGENNTAIGRSALEFNTTGSFNTALGQALFLNTTGRNNTAAGYGSLFANSSGEENTAVGVNSLSSNTIGFNNSSLGYSALASNTFGFLNTATGSRALNRNTSGSGNTAIGANSLNTVTVGSNNIGIGADAQVPIGTVSNQVRIGNTNISLAQIQVAWTVTSDRRWKTDIQDLPYGLSLVNQLHPVDYVRKNNDNKTRETGFIAQEVETVLEQLGYENQGILTKDDNGYLSLRYNDFVPVLTKAIQEQQSQIRDLQQQNDAMLAQMSRIQKQLAQLLSPTNEVKIKYNQNAKK